MADEGERQNLDNAAADNGQNEANLSIHNDDDRGTELPKTESVENLVDSLNLESCCVDTEYSNTNETESDSEFESDDSEVTDSEEAEEELSEGDGEEFVQLKPWTCERRHCGDGEEQPDKTTESKLDDDEDKQNPAYIPRKGSFFEHDLRLDDGVDVETDTQLMKKKLWYDRVKWQHDKFDERTQAPKSRDEIVAIYGFDIREENRVPLDATRRSVKKRTNKKGRSKRLVDYIVFAKPVPVSLERVRRPVEGTRHFCPRRSWPENTSHKRNVIMKSLSPETVRSSGFVVDGKTGHVSGKNSQLATPKTTAGHEDRQTEIPPCFQKGQDSSAERSSTNDSKYLLEKRSQTKFDPADGKLVFRSVRGNKTGRIGTGRVIGKSGPREFQAESRNNLRHDRQSMGNPNRPSKKHVGTRRISDMDRVSGPHAMRTICNSGTSGYAEVIETLKDAVAESDGQSGQRITSSAVTKSQDVRLLETQDCHSNVNRIGRNTGPETTGKDKGSIGYSKGSVRKSTVITHTTMAPEIIPPVTHIPTYTRSVETKALRGQPAAPAAAAALPSDAVTETVSSGAVTTPCIGWTGGEFIPSERLLPRTDASGRPKRYSSQRQKVGTETGLPELTGQSSRGTVTSVVTMPATAGFTSSLPQRPLPAATYYGSAPGSHGVAPFPQASVLPLGMSSITYTVPVSTNVPSGHIRVYSGPAIRATPVAMATATAPSLMHAPYLNPPGMLQGPYIGPPPVINYGPPLAPQYSLATGSIPVQFATAAPGPVRNPRPDGNPLEVRGGTVYFNPEIQQVDMLHGMVYFNPERQAGNVRSPVRRAKAAIPIVKPEDASTKEVAEIGEKQKEEQGEVGQEEVGQKEVPSEVEQEEVDAKQIEEEEEIGQKVTGQQGECEVPESKEKEQDSDDLLTECADTLDDNVVYVPESTKMSENLAAEENENELLSDQNENKTN